MELFCPSSRRRNQRTSGRSRARGFTLLETMVSLAVLVIASVGSVLSFMMLNQYAANLRNLSAAKELCQERIEQARTLPFSPPGITPAAPGQDGKWYYLLGMPNTPYYGLPTSPVPTTVPASTASTDYSTTGAYTGGSNTTSLIEPITIYAPRDGTTNTAITGTRTTSIAASPILDGSSTGTGSLNLVQFTVTVAYTFRGKSYTYSMYTLRGAD